MPTPTQYNDFFDDIKTFLDEDVIKVLDSGATVKKRMIMPNGTNDEDWIGSLRDTNGVVDIWTIGITQLAGLPPREKGPVGTFDKPIKVMVDYYADYRMGTDSSNSEADFLAKVTAFDLLLEQKWSCFTDTAIIEAWDTQMRFITFPTATVHWMSATLVITLEEIIL